MADQATEPGLRRSLVRYRTTFGALLALFFLASCTIGANRRATSDRPQQRSFASVDPENGVQQSAELQQRHDPTGSVTSQYETGTSTLQAPQPAPSPQSGPRIHMAARGCWSEHDAFIFPNGNRIEFYPYAPPYRFDHLLIHFANGDEIWGQPRYASPDCPNSNRCQSASLRLNPAWQACVPSGHLYEIRTLDGRPVLMSSLFQVTDTATKLSVNLNLALAQAGNIPTNGLLALGLAELAEEAGAFEEAQRFIDVASRSLEGAADARLRTEIEANLDVASGNLRRDLGNYAQAFSFYGQAVEKYRSVEDHKNAAGTLIKIAEIYRQVGDFRAAAQWYDYSLQESQQAGDDDAQMTDLLRLYYVTGQIGDLSAQAKYEHQGEQLASSVLKDRSKVMGFFLGDSFLAIGEIEAEYGNPADAMTMLQPLVAAYRKLPQNEPTLRKLAFASVFLGDAYMRAHRYEEALSAFRDAETIAEKYHSPEVMWVYGRIAFAYEKQGDLDAALSYDRRAAEVMERFGASQQLPELQLSSKELAWGIYENLTRVTLELYTKRPSAELLDQAFMYHEEGKARALLDLLNDAGVRAHEGVDPELVHQEDRLRGKIAALQNAFSDESVSELRKISLQQALTKQTAELRQVHDRMAGMNAKYESIASPTVARLADVQRLLDDGTVLLEYDLGPDFSGVAVITNRDIRVYRLPAQAVIDRTLEQFLPTLREPLLGSSETNRHVQLAKQLYADLVGPARDQIQGKHHIVIVPDADLFYLPFEAIIDPNAKPDGPTDSLASQPYLGKAYDFSYAPSASVLVTLKRTLSNPSSAQRPLLAFGDPAFQSTPAPSQTALSTRGTYEKMGVGFDRLPYSAEEVRGIMAVYGISPQSRSVYLGSKATKNALLGLDLSEYRTLHFATHAVMGDQVQWITQPALIFSPEKTGGPDSDVLKMSEIFNLRLNADLVVLSACETARGSLSRGEGIVGLTSAFLFAGSRSVVASLWDVNDESTSLFMESFYTGLKRGLSKADALREARLHTMRKQIKSAVTGEQESLASPYFWAPFVLIGEWN